jgi:hypothetical protein
MRGAEVHDVRGTGRAAAPKEVLGGLQEPVRADGVDPNAVHQRSVGPALAAVARP